MGFEIRWGMVLPSALPFSNHVNFSELCNHSVLCTIIIIMTNKNYNVMKVVKQQTNKKTGTRD